MAETHLKEKVTQGVAWSMAEKVGTMLLSMAVRLVILRLLTREILGYMAIPTAIVSVLLVLVDGGFSQSLIRRKNPSRTDYKSVFLFNMTVSVVCYLEVVALSPLAARWYDMPAMAEIAPVFYLLLPLSALSAVQNTIFIRQFRFALLSKVTFFASLVGGLSAIGCALAGWGIWSLVVERVVCVGLRTAALWWLSDWRPRGRSSARPLREMSEFGCSLMATDLISNFYNKIPQFFLGSMYPASTLGSFDQAVKIKDMPAVTGMQAVQSVTYPALSKIGGDERKFTESYRLVMMVVAFAMFPMMAGIIAVADDLFLLLLGEKWLPTVPYLRILCITGLFYPLAMIAYNILKVRSNGDIILKLEILKKIIMTAILAVTIPQSVEAVAWGLAAMSLCEFVVNFTASQRYTSLSLLRMVRTLLPTLLVTAAMYAAVMLVGRYVAGYGEALRLLVKIVTGVVVYVVLALAFRLEAAREIITVLQRMAGKR